MDSDLKKIVRRLNQRLGEARRFQEELTKRIQKIDRELTKIKTQRPSRER